MDYSDELKIRMDIQAAISRAKAVSEIPLGCDAKGGCFCTGRCRRTAEQERDYLESARTLASYAARATA